MYYRDHAPPHFHAVYSEQEAIIDIETLDVLEGRLSRRALELVLDWLSCTERNCVRTGIVLAPMRR